MLNKRLLLAGGCLLAIMAAPVAQAQDATVQESERSTTVGEIIVTADKRAQNLQDVPTAVSAFTDEVREDLGILSVEDIANFTPGMTYQADGDKVNIRGVGRLTATLGNDPGVAVYSDGFYSATARTLSRGTLYVERIEVLRGPQGTLYGRNSIGGAVNVISKRPAESFEGEARVAFGNYEALTAELALSGPITDRLRYRVAASKFDQSEGYFTNIAGGPSEGGVRDNYYLEGQLELDVTDTFSVWGQVSTEGRDERRRTGYNPSPVSQLVRSSFVDFMGAYVYGIPGAAFDSVPPIPGYLGLTNPASRNKYDFAADTPARQRLDDVFNGILRANWRTDAFDVTYIGGYATYEINNRNDADGSSYDAFSILPNLTDFTAQPAVVPNGTPGSTRIDMDFISTYREKKTYWSNELNITSNGTGPLKWLAGAYQYYEDSSLASDSFFPNQPEFGSPCDFSLTLLCGPDANPANPNNSAYLLLTDQEAWSYAVFGQVDYDLNEQWRLTAGLRHTWDRKEGIERNRLVAFFNPAYNAYVNFAYGAPLLAPGQVFDFTRLAFGAVDGVTLEPTTGLAVRRVEGEWDATSGTVGAQWTPRSDVMAYAKYTRGYKTGGFNLGGFNSAVDPELIDAFEVGAKLDVIPSLRLNLSAFLYSYKDLQTQQSQPIPGGLPGQTRSDFINISKARMAGLEVEATWQPTPAFTLLANYSYLNTELRTRTPYRDSIVLDGNDPVTQVQSVDGNPIPLSTPNKVALGATYTFGFTPGDLILSASYVWKDDTPTSIFDTALETIPASEQLDLRATWRDGQDRYRVIAFVQNVFDDEVVDSVVGNAETVVGAGATRTFNIAPPRLYGVELQMKF